MQLGMGAGVMGVAAEGPLAVWDFAGPVPVGASFSRASVATSIQSSGEVALVEANAARAGTGLGRAGLLYEPAASCVMPNRGLTGAVLGALGAGGGLPTGWSLYGDSGLVRVVATGQVGALSYVDLRLVGTPTQPVLAIFLSEVGAVPTTSGTAFCQSLWLQHLGGSTAGVDSALLRTIQINSAGVQAGDHINSVMSLTPILTRKVLTSTATAGTHHRPTLVLNLPTMGPIDITLRLACPNYVKAAQPSSAITLPTTGVGTRARDQVTLTANLGLCRVVVSTSAGLVTLENQNLNGAWVLDLVEPCVLYQIEAYRPA